MKKPHDFNALEMAVWASKVINTGDPIPPAEMMWDATYCAAIAAAIELDDFRPLLETLRRQAPLHPLLLPALADAIEARGRSKKSGRKRVLNSVQARRAADWVQYLRRKDGKSLEEAAEKVAEALQCGVSTVTRAYATMVPKHRRPGWKLEPSSRNRRRL